MAQLSIRSPDVEIRDTGTAKGRGVYAVRALSAGDHVETCPVIVFGGADYDALPQELKRRVFNWSKLICKSSGQYALALGYGSLYNHANPANLRYYATRTLETVAFVAVRTIDAGEELTINYDEAAGVSPTGDSSWMQRNRVEPV